jgi:hypothetical protein
MSEGNARRVEKALRAFGFGSGLNAELFLTPNNVIRMGVPPLRIEILTSISGVEFEPCYDARQMIQIDDEMVPVIGLAHLKQNKAASRRAKDLADLENLPA